MYTCACAEPRVRRMSFGLGLLGAVAGMIVMAAAGTTGAATILPSGVSLWLDANDGSTITADVNGISQWNDKSGLANHVSQSDNSRKPMLATGVLPGGLDAVSFDGGDWLGRTDANPATITRTGTAHTVFTVSQITDHTTNNAAGNLNRSLFDVTEVTNAQSVLHRNIYLGGSTVLEYSVRDEANDKNAVTSSNPLSSLSITTDVRSGNNLEMFIDGISIGSDSTNSLDAMDAGSFYTTVGAVRNGFDVNGGSQLIGNIAEIIVFDRMLNDAEFQAVGYYLEQKYNLDTAFVNLVPEPSTLMLCGLAITSTGMLRRRRLRKA